MSDQITNNVCGDNSCIFGPPQRLGTNGGCRCVGGMYPTKTRIGVTRNIQIMQKRITDLERQLAEQKLLHEQTAEQLKQCEGALEKRNATCSVARIVEAVCLTMESRSEEIAMSDKINEVVADLRETARVLCVDVKGFEATAIEISKTATEVESEWEIVKGHITDLERQLAEQKLLHEQTAEQLKQCEGALEKRNATCDELRAQLAERDALLTWRKWPEEKPETSGYYLTEYDDGIGSDFFEDGVWLHCGNSDKSDPLYWIPIPARESSNTGEAE